MYPQGSYRVRGSTLLHTHVCAFEGRTSYAEAPLPVSRRRIRGVSRVYLSRQHGAGSVCAYRLTLRVDACGAPRQVATLNANHLQERPVMAKYLKTAVALFATALVVGVLAAGIASAQRSKTFTDVPAGSYYEDAAYWAADTGITTGCDEDKFCPTGTLTRAEMITFLYRYDTNHTHPPDHTHEEREVESDPIRVEGPAGTDQVCSPSCQLNLPEFELSPRTVLLVGKDILPGNWHVSCFDRSDAYLAVLTKDVRNHPAYPGREEWRNYWNDLGAVQTGLATNSDGDFIRKLDTSSSYHSYNTSLDVQIEPYHYAVIYHCS